MAENSLTILNRILNNINDKYDVSVGSIFYDFASPVAIEEERLQGELEDIINKYFVETATGDDLTRKCAEMGVNRKEAAYASGIVIVSGTPGATIKKGELVANGLVSYEFMEDSVVPLSGKVQVMVRCTSIGSVGNVQAEKIIHFPKTLSGLNTVSNPAPFTNGYDRETDEELKKRYFLKVQCPPTSGNKYHYQLWALDVNGVGEAKVVPRWNGNGTVKVIITSANNTGASQELIQKTFDYIEENRPIGADVTVVSAVEKPINLTGTLILKNGYILNNVINFIKTNVKEYIGANSFNSTYISLAKIGQIILDTDGVIDYQDLKLNGKAENVSIRDEEIAVLGTVDMGV